MINKNDYGSYEAPEAIAFGIVNEAVICSSNPGSPDSDDYGDNNLDDLD